MQQTIKQIDRSLTSAKRGQSALSCVFQEGDLGCAFSLDGPFLFSADLVGTMLLLFFLYWFLVSHFLLISSIKAEVLLFIWKDFWFKRAFSLTCNLFANFLFSVDSYETKICFICGLFWHFS